MQNTPQIGRTLLAGTVVLALLAGCQSAPVTAPTPGPGASAAPVTNPSTAPVTNPSTAPVVNESAAPVAATGKDAVTVAEDLAGLLASEREAEDLNGLASDEDKAAYAILALDKDGKAIRAEEGMVAITAMPGAKPAVTGAKPPMQQGKPKPRLSKEQLVKLREGATKRAGEIKAQFEKKATEKLKEAAKRKLTDAAKAKLEERAKTRKERVKGRLEVAKAKMDKAREALKKAEWVSNGDGTQSKTIGFEHTNGTTSRSRKIVRTVREDDKVLVSLVAEFKDTKANGSTTTINRSKTLNEDGSYTVLFNSIIVLPNGTTRTADWTKTIAADGKVSGTGTIVWVKDGETVKTVNITLGGTEDKETATGDAGEGTAEVVVPADEAPTAKVTDEAGAETSVEIATEEDGTVAVSDEGEAEATAEAEASAEAETTPDA